MKIVFISDTHNLHDQITVPDGDILIHAGDLTMAGTAEEINDAGRWLRSLPHKYKIVIAGNHDFLFEKNPGQAKNLLGRSVTYLQDNEIEIEGLRIWGSPWQPWFMNWAFGVPRGQLHKYWDLIPKELDILVTHGPPYGFLDQASPYLKSEHLGDEELLETLRQTALKIHVFGHIHGGFGASEFNGIKLYNASAVDEAYRPFSRAHIVDL